ncbi:MAG: galactose-1-phosphate uridylyltransferase [Acidobacteriia bacterium]|nr:galactose-1-phosphate uridylyltransferase [Terriglobia bacterium]
MPELRQNRFTKEWVIMSTERAKRPEDLRVQHDPRPPLPAYSEKCPFCPGNERLAPPAVMAIPADGKWEVRIVPNKFAALSREGEPWRKIERSRRSLNGVGIHEVIVETPNHALTTALLPVENVAEILRAYQQRFTEISADPRITHVTIFKNHGAAAGTSLEHPHSQLIGTPVISSQVRNRVYEALRHYDEFGECIFCEAIKEDLASPARVVVTTQHFFAVEPFASSTPFATYIYPRRHMASFGAISDAEIVDLAKVLKTVLAKLYVGLQNPDFNYTIRTAPHENAGVLYYHWYLSVIPRLTRVAGFELGSGMFINTVLPEAAAEFLRNVKVDLAAAAD